MVTVCASRVDRPIVDEAGDKAGHGRGSVEWGDPDTRFAAVRNDGNNRHARAVADQYRAVHHVNPLLMIRAASTLPVRG